VDEFLDEEGGGGVARKAEREAAFASAQDGGCRDCPRRIGLRRKETMTSREGRKRGVRALIHREKDCSLNACLQIVAIGGGEEERLRHNHQRKVGRPLEAVCFRRLVENGAGTGGETSGTSRASRSGRAERRGTNPYFFLKKGLEWQEVLVRKNGGGMRVRAVGGKIDPASFPKLGVAPW